jgi:hypothetical protein
MSRGLANDIQLTVREDGDSMRYTLQAARSHIYLQVCLHINELSISLAEI